MIKIFYLNLILFISVTCSSQKKWLAGFNIGLGKNYYYNDYQTDNKYFTFKRPMSFSIGAQFLNQINNTNFLVTQFSFTKKKIKLEYNTNEAEIPYQVNEIVTDKFDCLTLSVGYRKQFKICKKFIFTQIDLTSDYNLNSSQSNMGFGNGTREFNEEILFKSFNSNNLGQKSITLGIDLTTGFYFSKSKKSEISININCPFNSIQNKTSNFQYIWEYKGKEYVHYIDYKGKIIYPSIKYTFYAFSKK